MTKEQLLEGFQEIIEKLNNKNKKIYYDEEDSHIDADNLLIEFINDEQIENAYHKIPKWYS